MDQDKIQSIMVQSFKSLTVSQIEILVLSKPLLKVRVVAEAYASKSIPERVEILTKLLRNTSSELSLNYAIAFEPLTPTEYFEWYGSEGGKNSNQNGSSGMAAIEAEQ